MNSGMGSVCAVLSSIFGKNVTIGLKYSVYGKFADIDKNLINGGVYTQFRFSTDAAAKGLILWKSADVKKILSIIMQMNISAEFDEIMLGTVKEINSEIIGSAMSVASALSEKKTDIAAESINLFSDSSEILSLSGIGDTEQSLGSFTFSMQIAGHQSMEFIIVLPSELYMMLAGEQEEQGKQIEQRAQKSPEIPDLAVSEIPDFIAEPETAPVSKPAHEQIERTEEPIAETHQEYFTRGDQMDKLRPAVSDSDSSGHTVKLDLNKIKEGVKTIKKSVFPDFSRSANMMISAVPDEEGPIMDVVMEINVELGRTKEKMRDIINYAKDTLISLEKQAGAPVDVIVNGQVVARGDVIVIDENFGVRLTEIVGDNSFINRKIKV